MRGSRPMPDGDLLTSAPTSSQTFAISLMKEILVARNALEASLIISAEATSVRTIGRRAPRRAARRASAAHGDCVSAPTTTRSGCMKSATAEPSFRNSGLEA